MADALGNPKLQLFDSHGVIAAANDNWSQGSDAATIQAAGLAPAAAEEAAILVTLAPGALHCD